MYAIDIPDAQHCSRYEKDSQCRREIRLYRNKPDYCRYPYHNRNECLRKILDRFFLCRHQRCQMKHEREFGELRRLEIHGTEMYPARGAFDARTDYKHDHQTCYRGEHCGFCQLFPFTIINTCKHKYDRDSDKDTDSVKPEKIFT